MTRNAIVLALVLFLLFAIFLGWLLGSRSTEINDSPTLLFFSNSPAVVSPAPVRPVAPAIVPPAQEREEIVGIGVILRVVNGSVRIQGVVANSPAAEAGLDGHFVIRKIDDALADGMPLKDCVDLLRGPAGSRVRLEVFDQDANETRVVELMRRKLQVQNNPRGLDPTVER
jgi:hypothetical protein